MTFAVIVPISMLPVILILWIFGDYLLTMLGWLAATFAVLVFVFFCDIFRLPTFVILSAVSLLLAPIIGIAVRDRQELRQAQEKQRQQDLKKQKAQEWWLLWELHEELSGHRWWSGLQVPLDDLEAADRGAARRGVHDSRSSPRI